MRQAKIAAIAALTTLIAACSQPESGLARLQAAQAARDAQPGYDQEVALGRAYASLGRRPEAIEAYERAVTLAPDSLPAHRELCYENNIIGNWSQALRHCEAARKARPDSSIEQDNLEYARRGRAAQKAEILAIARSASADGPELVNLGLKLYSNEDYAEAIEVWSRIPEESPYFATARNDAASAYILMRRFGPARQALDQALRRDPENPLFQNNARWLEREAGSASAK